MHSLIITVLLALMFTACAPAPTNQQPKHSDAPKTEVPKTVTPVEPVAPTPAANIKIDKAGISRFNSIYDIKENSGFTIYVCSSYGCRHKSAFTYNKTLLETLKDVMKNVVDADTERKALRNAIALIEKEAGKATGTSTDRAGLDFMGNDDKTQMDCVDEASNTTNYLIMMATNGLIKYHNILAPKEVSQWFSWPHYVGMIEDIGTKKAWRVDSSVGANGAPPVVYQD